MTVSLLRSRTVLGRVGGTDRISYGYLDEHLNLIQTLVIDREKYVDLGSPEYITITIEPGDLLNDVHTEV